MATHTIEDLTLLDQLRALRKEKLDSLSELVTSRVAPRKAFEERSAAFEKRSDATDDEKAVEKAAQDTFDAAERAHDIEFDKRETEIAGLDRRIKEQIALDEARKAAADASKGTSISVREPATYRKDNADKVSYFRDLCHTQGAISGAIGGNAAEAIERLQRHAVDSEKFLQRRAQEKEQRANREIENAERQFRNSFVSGVKRGTFDSSPFERRVNPNLAQGQGGYFVPPEWLIEEFIPYLRAGRVAAGLCRQMDLPEGTDSINIPKVSTPTLVAPQNSNNAAVASQDVQDSAVQANVKTLAGQEDVAIQLIEQSPGQIFDRVVMEDLIADYNRLVDRMVIYGSGQNTTALNAGQISGIYPATNWSANQVTWTSASPLGQSFNQVLAAMASKASYNRYSLDNFHYVMHPRRWFWFASQLDGSLGQSGRPLVNASDFGPFNLDAMNVAEVPFEGLAGRVPFGPSVYIDGNVPTNDNGSGSQSSTYDIAIGAKWDDLWLFEGDLRTRVLPEVLSGTLEVRFQVYNYLAFLVRYGQSISLGQGSGFGAPVGSIDSSITY